VEDLTYTKEGAIMKFREHRGGLAESMATVVELDTKEKFLSHLRKLIPNNAGTNGHVSFEQYEYDERIDWDTYLVRLEGYGVLGMLDGPPPREWWPPINFIYYKEPK
jgi:hypothetical protein